MTIDVALPRHTAGTQSEFAFKLRPPRFRQTEFPWRIHESRSQVDYEPEKAWGTQEDVRQHVRFGGKIEDY
jgi:hypothetical protein